MQFVHDESERSSELFRGLDEAQAAAFEARRSELLAAIAVAGRQSFGGSKPHCGELSPGCQRCGVGTWSCLFLNQICNAKCFFCPWVMDMKDAPPHAERVVFRSPADYAAYVERLGFQGVSFSGGEPFLTTDLLVSFIEALRDRVGDALYIWAYTNGLPATPERLERAARAGLNEVRFNISDHDYTLDHVARAIGVVPRVTIEVPAIPEDADQVRALLTDMRELGVQHLNLHQLMLTGQNGSNMMTHDYTYQLHPVPVVIESELSALETIRFALEQQIDLPINYCSYIYKDRWQNRVEHLRTRALIKRGYETESKAGWLRRLWIEGDPAALGALAEGLPDADAAVTRWELSSDDKRLYLHPTLLDRVDVEANPVRVAYFRAVLGEEDTTDWARRMYDYHTIALSDAKTIGVRLLPLNHPIDLSAADLAALRRDEVPDALVPFETMARGLPGYL